MITLHLACLGGCINRQPGVDRDAHYHAVLVRNLRLANPPVITSIAIGSYLSVDRMVERAVELLKKSSPDVLCVYVRPFTLMPLHKLFVRFETAGRRITWAWHPALFRRKLAWDPRLSEFQTEWPFVYVPHNRFGWRDWNLLSGWLLGLHAWARQYVLHQLRLLNVCCAEHGAGLIVMAPAQNPDSIMGNYLCEQAFQAIRAYCSEQQIPLLDAHRFGPEYFEADRLHFIPSVHTELGEMLTELVGEYLKGKNRAVFDKSGNVL